MPVNTCSKSMALPCRSGPLPAVASTGTMDRDRVPSGVAGVADSRLALFGPQVRSGKLNPTKQIGRRQQVRTTKEMTCRWSVQGWSSL